MRDALITSCGILWTAAYVLAIGRGFMDRSHAIPMGALFANIAWEIEFGLVLPEESPVGAFALVWLLLDLVLLAQMIAFRRREFPGMKDGIFFPLSAVLLTGSLLTIHLSHEAGLYIVSSAYLQSVTMSLFFLLMLFLRRSSRGQSLWIAVTKGLGTAAAIVYSMTGSGLPSAREYYIAFVFIGVLDLAYVIALAAVMRRERRRPWSFP